MRIPPDIMLLDGATGTELDRRGVDVSLPLWSARAIPDAPDVLQAVHREYLEAGAHAITACTFRTHRRSLAKVGQGHRAEALTRRAVEIACAARDEVNSDAIVLGSVAPLEDCYRPDLVPHPGEVAREHAEMIRAQLDAGADMILIETMNNRAESVAAAGEAARLAPSRWIISFCTKSHGPPGLLLSGQPLTDLLPTFAESFAVCVNCIAPESASAQIRLIRTLLPEHVRVGAYANIGEADPSGQWVSTDAIGPDRYAALAEQWLDAGATIVGGCCGTTPDTIRAVAARLATRVHAG
jgi:S-methylmethionine-dependent homocysteine/selenocysteine methylase